MAKKWIFSVFVVSIILLSCSKDDDNKVTNRLNHVGEKWKISSVEYTIVDQSTSGMGVKMGTATDAGAFYLNGAQGTFDILISKWHEEDYFSFSDNSGDVQMINITQSVGGSTNISQSVFIISGTKTATTMAISGTITRQSTGGQFVMTGEFNLVKE